MALSFVPNGGGSSRRGGGGGAWEDGLAGLSVIGDLGSFVDVI